LDERPRFLLIGGFASSLINFRGPLLRTLTTYFDVYAAAPFINEEIADALGEMKVNAISTRFDRTGINPLSDLKATWALRNVVKQVKPDMVMAYTIKPVVFGLKAASGKGIKRFALITGKGSGFDGTGLKSSLIKQIVKRLYTASLKNCEGIIFQNQVDAEYFTQEKILKKEANLTVIEGTGVDMEHYHPTEREPNEQVTFLFIARLIKEKGIPELIAAAKLLKSKGLSFEVQILGWVDPNPGGISQEEINELHESGLINYLGATNDIRPFMNNADVFVLPSYYNEGLPRTLQEAMAMKKPIVTTDHPGCRETVSEGLNGYLIPTRSAHALAAAMQKFINDPSLITKMGEASRKICMDKFDVHKINKRLLNFMQVDV